VLAAKLENLDSFPLQSSLYDCSYHSYTLRWIVNGLSKRLTGDYDLYRRIILKLHRAKLLHAHFGPIGYSLLELKQKMRLPLITTFYGFDMSLLPRIKEWKDKYKQLFAEGDLFLAEGSNMKSELIQLGCPHHKIKIQHIAIDTEKFEFRKRLSKAGRKVILLFCGRFMEKKGLIYSLMAFREVLSKYPNIEFRIIGDGDLRTEIEDYIDHAKLRNKVTILGMQSHAVVETEMQNSDIFLHPSVTAANGDSEGGAPTILLEAQATGMPVLSTYHADIPEVVVPGKSALLSNERDWRSLAANLLFLLKNQDAWCSMGEAGRRHVESRHDIQKQSKKLEEIYFQLIKNTCR